MQSPTRRIATRLVVGVMRLSHHHHHQPRMMSTNSSGGIRLGKNRNAGIKEPASTSSSSAPVATEQAPQVPAHQQQPYTPPPTYYQQQPQQPQTLGQSIVSYAILGFAFAFGISLVRVVFSEGKDQEEGENADITE